MAGNVKPIPDGYHTVTPYLIVNGGAQALDFYQRAFGATELLRMEHQGKIGHAEIKIGDSPVMLADEFPEMGGTPVTIHLYVPDVDALFAQALAAGAKETRPVKDQFYGDRAGELQDPFGHRWYLATHKEDLTMEEVKKRDAQAGH